MKNIFWLFLGIATFFCSCGDDSTLPPIEPRDSSKSSGSSSGGNVAAPVKIPDELKLRPGEIAKPFKELADDGALVRSDEDPYSGVAEDWYENGQRKSWARYVDGQPDGKQFFWSPNGQKLQEAEFKKGSLDGKQLFWADDGTLKEERVWVNGQRLEFRRWEKGQLVEESISKGLEPN